MCKRFEEVLANHCAPALCGVKSSNLINLSFKEFPFALEWIEELNERLNPGLVFEVLRQTDTSVLLLVYKPEKLYGTIFKESNYKFLLNNNYPIKKEISSYLDFLKSRIKQCLSFPHEIGVFLGYDLDDVLAFESGNEKCLYTGYWKVYSNVESKIQTFEVFTKCTKIITGLINDGHSIYELA